MINRLALMLMISKIRTNEYCLFILFCEIYGICFRQILLNKIASLFKNANREFELRANYLNEK